MTVAWPRPSWRRGATGRNRLAAMRYWVRFMVFCCLSIEALCAKLLLYVPASRPGTVAA